MDRWDRFLGRVEWPRLLLVGLLVVVVSALGIGGAITMAVFHPFNPTWEGTSEWRVGIEDDPQHEVTFLQSEDDYERLTANDTVYVFSPEERYDEEAVQAIDDFVAAGGTLVVLENFGENGNQLLADLGVEMRFDGLVLQDEQHYDRDPKMLIANQPEEHPLTVEVAAITLNHGTAVSAPEASVLLSTSNVTYLGEEDAEIGDDDLATYPVVAVEEIGAGQVIAVGDPSIAINEMVHLSDNWPLLHNFARGSDRIAIDLSHTAPIPPIRLGLLMIRANAWLGSMLGILAIVSVAAIQARGREETPFGRTTKRTGQGGSESRSPAASTPVDGAGRLESSRVDAADGTGRSYDRNERNP